MEKDFNQVIEEAVERVFNAMEKRVRPEDMQRIRQAYALASEAHSAQRRKSGEPYIIHPISVALIAASELKLDADSVIAAFLHDVVEDTPYTVEDIAGMFGPGVANLVDVVTKKKKDNYSTSKQVDNYQQLLDSVHYDIRALMVKIADRLHNMRTLASMRPDKQMKIAGETDYFYAPLANRLGLFDVKTDLENLSFKFRCPLEFRDIEAGLQQDTLDNKERLDAFCQKICRHLEKNGIEGVHAQVYYRRPYSLWRRMRAEGKDFKHVENRYYIRVTFSGCNEKHLSQKIICLRIYALLTDIFKERPESFVNLLDQAKENSYQCIKVMLLSDGGIWEDVQICSDQMVERSRIGCLADMGEKNVQEWIERFRLVLKDIAKEGQDTSFLENVVTSLYYDDVMVFTPEGRGVILPKGATAIDFAFERGPEIGLHAYYARINGKLMSLKTELKRGDCVEIGTVEDFTPKEDWMDFACSYSAKRNLRRYLAKMTASHPPRCPYCQPLPGGDTVGFKDLTGRLTIHRKSCPEIIRLSSKMGDNIEAYDFQEKPGQQFPVTVVIKAVDRYHLLMDLIDNITNQLHLSIESLTTTTRDNIADCTITFYVHSVKELVHTLSYLYTIPGVDEVHQHL